HGRKHDISPSDVNYRANLYALKQLGCTHVIATTACGSLQHEFAPGDLVFIDQFIDKTKKDRGRTFYDGKSKEFPGICHLPMGTPYCDVTRQKARSLCTLYRVYQKNLKK
uniref:Nucleoside phosphorylase domain-containing protein n=1 Tax=Romanomermis culicivorax TaxID=13658 RepID=A0A915I0P2_ROMCU